MKTNLWCQINDFLFIWKGNREQINYFGWGGGGGGGGGEGGSREKMRGKVGIEGKVVITW